MMQIPGIGAFVRCLLPVHLTGGFTVTFGVWLAVDPADLQRAARTWFAPDYHDLVLDGWLANDLPVWGLGGTPAHASVRDPDQTPYVDGSSDTALSRVLSDEWEHDRLLSALP